MNFGKLRFSRLAILVLAVVVATISSCNEFAKRDRKHDQYVKIRSLYQFISQIVEEDAGQVPKRLEDLKARYEGSDFAAFKNELGYLDPKTLEWEPWIYNPDAWGAGDEVLLMAPRALQTKGVEHVLIALGDGAIEWRPSEEAQISFTGRDKGQSKCMALSGFRNAKTGWF